MPSRVVNMAEPLERIARKPVQGVRARRSWVWFNPAARYFIGLMGLPAVHRAIARRRGR